MKAMGLFSALTTGVSGLQSQSNKIGVISDNIANVNTVGYKRNQTNFQALIAGNGFSFSAGGATGVTKQMNGVQGGILNTFSPTDIAISGTGFFPVSQQITGSGILYTRAGAFTPDADGNFRNGAGYYLQGWLLDGDGTLSDDLNASSVSASTAIAALTTVNIRQLTAAAVPTSSISIQANLKSSQAVWAGPPAYDAAMNTANMASGTIAPHFDRVVNIVDSAGVLHNCELNFLKTGTNSWSVEIVIDPATDVASGNGQVATGTITFNGDGTLASVSSSLAQALNINWAVTDPENIAGPSSITFDWGTAGPISGAAGTVLGQTDGLSQFDGNFHVRNIRQDGVQAGDLTSVVINPHGYVTANYSNGTARNFYKIPLANFSEPKELETVSGNVYTQTLRTGDPVFSQSTHGSEILSGALELSNVDIASQLTDMIIAQRAYQSNTKIITAMDDMLEKLAQI